MRWTYIAAAAAVALGLLLVARRASAGTVFAPAEFWNDVGDSAAPSPEAFAVDDFTAIEDRNVAAFLETLKFAEGTLGRSQEYDVLFGYNADPSRVFTDFSRHPRVYDRAHDTTAAGAYQINWPTYLDVAPDLGITDFSPASQDLIAIELIRRAGALDDVRAGNFEAAVAKLGGRWASLPSSRAGQPVRSLDSLLSAFLRAGGTLAG